MSQRACHSSVEPRGFPEDPREEGRRTQREKLLFYFLVPVSTPFHPACLPRHQLPALHAHQVPCACRPVTCTPWHIAPPLLLVQLTSGI